MTNTEQQEIWKTYPEYPFIEVSNFGKIRTKDRYIPCNGGKRLIKGRILKQQLNNKGYLYVHINVNGKIFNRLVHRIVAASHLPNPDNLPEVNHKDNNPKNNDVSNLEWCTRQYNNDYKKNFGTTPAEVFGRPVIAVNLKTGKVLYFNSQSEAARQLDVSQGHIAQVIKGERQQTGGYWFTEDESEITEKKIKKIKDNMRSHQVIAINPETYEVFWFKSQSEAGRQLGIDNSDIGKVVKGKKSKASGHWFCKVDKNAVEKTRSRFGDDIASKVEKLMNKHNMRN